MEKRIDETQRQLMICRQSQLKLVMDYSKQINKPFKFSDMLAYTEVLVEYCMKGYKESVVTKVKGMDAHIEKLFVEE